MLFGPVHGSPTIASKLNTLLQILFCLAVVAAAAYGWPPGWALSALGGLVIVSTAVSGLDYVLTYSRRASSASRERAAARG
jgi:cardiolipin synthase